MHSGLSGAKKQYDKATDSQELARLFSEMDETVGEYMSPIMIIHKQGGFKHLESIRRGRNIIKNSFKISGNMGRYNALSEGWDIMNLKVFYKEKFEKQWLGYSII